MFCQAWNGAISSNWNVASNWTPAAVPGPTSAVVINNRLAPHQPSLSADISISSLAMSQGILNLNGFAIQCSAAASLSGDSLLNGKIVALDFVDVTNMRMGGKVILEKLNGSSNNDWTGGNKVHNDSLIIIWHGGRLNLELNRPDSIFSSFKVVLLGGQLYPAFNHILYVEDDMILDNSGAATIHFSAIAPTYTRIGGNLVGLNFENNTSDLFLKSVLTNGPNLNGPFCCRQGLVSASSFHGNFSLIVDSAFTCDVMASYFYGAENLLQGGVINAFVADIFYGNTTIRFTSNTPTTKTISIGSNQYLGNIVFEAAPALASGDITLQLNNNLVFSGDTRFILNNNSFLSFTASTINFQKGLSIQNDGSGSITQDGSSHIYFAGSDTANYSFSGSGTAPLFAHVGMNRQGGLRLQSGLVCTDLILTKGIILSSSIAILQMPAMSVVTGGGDNSYVDGPMIKTGNTAFTFPLGKNNLYAPLSISSPVTTTDAFQAQYFSNCANDDGYDTTQRDVSLHHLSTGEYWLLSRLNGSSAVKVTLSWKQPRSGIVDVINDLRVARWNGSMWKDEGRGATSGTNYEGNIQSLNDIVAFSRFTLASSSANNPLPVTYIYFTASLQVNRSVVLNWETGSETGNSFFEIERSNDGRNWSSIGTMDPVFSHRYSFADKGPVIGFNYYRIKQVDIDSKFSYSAVRLVRIAKEARIFAWPDPVSDILTIQAPFTGSVIEIYNTAGKMMWKSSGGKIVNTVSVSTWPAGVYVILLKRGTDKLSQKFLKQ